MSTTLKAGQVTVTHANYDAAGLAKNNQIFMTAEAIWGITSDKLPQAKFDELKAVLENHLTREYGPYRVKGFGDTFVIYMNPEVLNTSYKKSPCSLGTCMVTNAAFKCARCKEAMYCSKEHQIQDWSRHKVECISKK
jgi:hypothetical protein